MTPVADDQAPVLPYGGGSALSCERDGDRLHAYVPGKGDAGVVRLGWVTLGFILTMAYPLWTTWAPVIRRTLAAAPADRLAVDGCLAVMTTAMMAVAYAVCSAFGGRPAVDPVSITADPTGCRVERLDGRGVVRLYRRNHIARVTCRPFRRRTFAVLILTGRFARWWPGNVSRPLAIGTAAELAVLADALRQVLRLTEAPVGSGAEVTPS